MEEQELIPRIQIRYHYVCCQAHSLLRAGAQLHWDKGRRGFAGCTCQAAAKNGSEGWPQAPEQVVRQLP